MKHLQPILIASLATFAMTPVAFAGADSGLYVGAGVGIASVGDLDSDLGNADFDDEDTGWKVFAGYNFGWIPFLDIAVEGGYVDFGKPDDNGIEVEADGWDLFGVVGGKLGPVGVFGKLGAINWDADANGAVNAGDDGTDPAYGVGLRFQIMSLQVRGEYEYFDVGSADDVSLLSASVAWTF